MFNQIHSINHSLYRFFLQEERSIVKSVSFLAISFFTAFTAVSICCQKKYRL